MKKPLHDRLAAARLRQAQLAARVAAMEKKQKAADRKRDTRRKIIVGAAVLVEMERTPRFAAFVRDMLDKAVVRPQDRDAIADLVQSAAQVTTPAVNGNTAPVPSAPVPDPLHDAAGDAAVLPSGPASIAFAAAAEEQLAG